MPMTTKHTHRWEPPPPEWTLSASLVAAEASERLEPDWAFLRLSAAEKGTLDIIVTLGLNGIIVELRHNRVRDQFGVLCDAFLRVDEPLEWFSLDDSSRKTDLGLCFCLGLGVLGLTRPCSSNISCCFLLRYSCLISSRRVFSSSLRRRSSSAFRLAQVKHAEVKVVFPAFLSVRRCHYRFHEVRTSLRLA